MLSVVPVAKISLLFRWHHSPDRTFKIQELQNRRSTKFTYSREKRNNGFLGSKFAKYSVGCTECMHACWKHRDWRERPSESIIPFPGRIFAGKEEEEKFFFFSGASGHIFSIACGILFFCT